MNQNQRTSNSGGTTGGAVCGGATFWVGLVVDMLTILFGLARTVEGALQVYETYHSS